MNYTSTKNERESDIRRPFSSYVSAKRKRIVALVVLTLCLLFAGAHYTPTAEAGAQCPMVCGDPYTDPVDGQCYVDCCPADPMMKCACVRYPCK